MPEGRSDRGKAYHHGDLREALVDVATDLVRERGPSGFSLREAARRVGVDPAACYRHYRDRADLLLAIAQRGFLALAEQMEQAVSSLPRADSEQRMLAMGRVYVVFACDHPAEFRVMFGESGTTAQDPRLRVAAMRRSAYQQLEDVVRAWARERGQRVQVTQCARVLWSGVHGVSRLVVDGALVLSRPEVLALGDRMTRVLVAGLAASPRRK
jgi:AcrR family transcriptional regulator